PDDALKHLQHYDRPTQELFLRLLPPLAMLSRKSFDQLSAQDVAVLNEQLQALLLSLRPRCELAIDKMCFCEWAKSYGIYKPLADGHMFHASDGQRPGELVQVYVELRNFACERREGHYETRLASSVEIRDHKGEQVWFYRFDKRQENLRSRTLLHDYSNNYSFYVPHIPPGTYTLTIQVADETRPEARRIAQKSLEFRVTAPALRSP